MVLLVLDLGDLGMIIDETYYLHGIGGFYLIDDDHY